MWRQLQIRTYRRNSQKYDSDRFDFSSPTSTINTCDSSSFGTYSLLDIWYSQSVTLSWLDRRSACRYPPHHQVSGRWDSTAAPETRLEAKTAMPSAWWNIGAVCGENCSSPIVTYLLFPPLSGFSGNFAGRTSLELRTQPLPPSISVFAAS